MNQKDEIIIRREMEGIYLGVKVTEHEVDLLERAKELMAKHHVYSVAMEMLISRLRACLEVPE